MVSGVGILKRAGILLQDEDYVRWTIPELVGWVNDGVKAIVLAKPSASSETRVLTLEKGTLQRVAQVENAATALALLSIKRNITSSAPARIGGRSVTVVSHSVLEASSPDWHDPVRGRFSKDVRHYTYDENVPLEFYVYPGNTGEGMVEAAVSTVPADLAASGAPDSIDSYAAPIGLPEPYSGPVLDYVLHRAFSKDALEGAPGRAQMHYAAFASAIGLKIQVERASSPNAARGGA
ncbi:hypothetical protein SAMN05216456_1314 [Devosia crocina]|uniref:Uncharacterized protein n=1 Tax=Devosia crocina TaxID=429728 RepID=A0A1I7N9U7_9HYPH|nr:DUF6682 family protein [Devosia crocina]SFV31353.1 hypothetical protein SAMN05216456_1314 [Devosia crocina]